MTGRRKATHPVAQVGVAVGAEGMAVQEQAPGRGLVQAQQQGHQGALPRARGPHQCQHLPGAQLQGHTLGGRGHLHLCDPMSPHPPCCVPLAPSPPCPPPAALPATSVVAMPCPCRGPVYPVPMPSLPHPCVPLPCPHTVLCVPMPNPHHVSVSPCHIPTPSPTMSPCHVTLCPPTMSPRLPHSPIMSLCPPAVSPHATLSHHVPMSPLPCPHTCHTLPSCPCVPLLCPHACHALPSRLCPHAVSPCPP